MNKNLVTVIIVIIVLVLLYYFYNSKENFESDSPTRVIIFVSETCPHCVEYKEKKHDNLVNSFVTNSNVKIDLIHSGESEEANKLFAKYDIQYVPACVIVKGNKVEKLGNAIEPEIIKQKIASM